ncbi:MAG TPA: aldehyde dehydrogenase family protein [Usitatibacter sp.]|jgi:aldehyde dehydrogenase (NAD+)|nr:aldehyde dehydrogenase family protein [Usitatibacter sp.]
MNKAGDLPLTAQTLACHFIGNEWVRPAGGRTLPVVDPSTGEVFAEIARGGAEDIDRAVKAARAAFDGPWGALAPAERGRLLLKLSQLITVESERLARIESRDVGKPFAQSQRDIAATARYFEFYSGACDKLAGEVLPYPDGYTVMAMRVPFGVTGHIVPWNYPSQIFGRSVGASLAAGNACVLKPPEDACLALLEIANLASEAGFPAGALNVVTGLGNEAGAALSAHPGIDHISFTGSPATGTAVAQAAAAHHCPVTLELGGKSPQIVFADADIDAAVPVIVNAIVQNAGQTCSAGSRLLVERVAYEIVLAKVAERFKALECGPGEKDFPVGPLVNARQHARVSAMVGRAEADGLRCVARGSISPTAPKGGFYFPPTLFADVPPLHQLAQEEVFGPVLVAMPFDTEAEAIALANATAYGLVAGVWTRDGGRQLRLARKLNSGQVFVNDYGAGGGVELPFGGVKKSGHGREKGLAGLLSFTTIKTVAIKHN